MPPNGGDERRTLDELETRYLLEPELGDVFVEGPTGAALVSWFLDLHERRNWRVYSIETVDVPSASVNARGLDVGARGRVLTLGAELSERLRSIAGRKPVIIADRDVDALTPSPEVICDLCLFTDFTSMEMYAFNARTLDKFLRLFIRTKRIRADELIASLTSALVDIFVVRAVLYGTKTGIGIIQDVAACCARRTGGVEVDLNELVRRSVNASEADPRPSVEAVVIKCGELKASIPTEVRLAIHGHDFVRLLGWFLRAYGVSASMTQNEVISRALFNSLQASELIDYPLFTELLDRTAP